MSWPMSETTVNTEGEAQTEIRHQQMEIVHCEERLRHYQARLDEARRRQQWAQGRLEELTDDRAGSQA